MDENVQTTEDRIKKCLDPDRLTTALLITKLSVNYWRPRKSDRRSTKEAMDALKAEREAGKVLKMLVSKEAWAPVIRAIGAVRTTYYSRTLPWGTGGRRVVAAAEMQALHAVLAPLVSAAEDAWREFVVTRYDSELAKAPARLGRLYDRADFPSKTWLLANFGISLSCEPVPVADDFRVSLPRDILTAMRNELTSAVRESVSGAMKEAWDRTFEVSQKLVEKLKDKDSVFRDSLVDNVKDVCGLLKGLNLTGNADLDNMRIALEDLLDGVDVAELRLKDNAAAMAKRDSLAQSAERILSQYEGFRGMV